MAQLVCSSATLTCSFGTAPATLLVPPTALTSVGATPAATIMDHRPMGNIGSFLMCTSLANPQVASATAAAQGVLTPMPCVPATPAPWAPGSPTVLIGGNPALTSTSQCACTWGGVITVTNPGQTSTQLP